MVLIFSRPRRLAARSKPRKISFNIPTTAPGIHFSGHLREPDQVGEHYADFRDAIRNQLRRAFQSARQSFWAGCSTGAIPSAPIPLSKARCVELIRRAIVVSETNRQSDHTINGRVLERDERSLEPAATPSRRPCRPEAYHPSTPAKRARPNTVIPTSVDKDFT